MSGTMIAIIFWIGMCGGWLILGAVGEIIDKLCVKFPKIARWIDGKG